MISEAQKMLDRLSRKNSNCSDYRLAKILGVTAQAVSNWRTGVSSFDDAIAVKVAELLDENPAYIIALINADRAKSDTVRRVYKEIAGKFKGAAAVILAVGLCSLSPEKPAFANAQLHDFTRSIYTLCEVRRRCYG